MHQDNRGKTEMENTPGELAWRELLIVMQSVSLHAPAFVLASPELREMS